MMMGNQNMLSFSGSKFDSSTPQQQQHLLGHSTCPEKYIVSDLDFRYLSEELKGRLQAIETAVEMSSLRNYHGAMIWTKALANPGELERACDHGAQVLMKLSNHVRDACSEVPLLSHWTSIVVSLRTYTPAMRHQLVCKAHWKQVLNLPDEEFEHRLQLAIRNAHIEEKSLWEILSLLHNGKSAFAEVKHCMAEFQRQEALEAEALAQAQSQPSKEAKKGAGAAKADANADDDGKGKKRR